MEEIDRRRVISPPRVAKLLLEERSKWMSVDRFPSWKTQHKARFLDVLTELIKKRWKNEHRKRMDDVLDELVGATLGAYLVANYNGHFIGSLLVK
jgi:hypothetical protein